jgi:hypothetical protein
MAYRRSGKELHASKKSWEAWLSKNKELIKKSGLPSTVMKTSEDWWYFIDYTYHQGFRNDEELKTVPWFELDMLTSEQKKSLWQLLVSAVKHFEIDESRKDSLLARWKLTYGSPMVARKAGKET